MKINSAALQDVVFLAMGSCPSLKDLMMYSLQSHTIAALLNLQSAFLFGDENILHDDDATKKIPLERSFDERE